MTRCLLCPIIAMSAALAFTPSSSADAGIPAPSVDLGFLFKNLDKYPDYDFYLKYGHGRGDPTGRVFLTRVQSETYTRLEGSGNRHSDIFLIAVPRGQAVALPEKGPNREWLRAPPEGGRQSSALKGDPAGGGSLGNGYDITYQVRLEGDHLEVEWVESNLNAWWSNARLIAILIAAACVLIPIAIVVFVVLLIVRLSRRPPSPSSDAT